MYKPPGAWSSFFDRPSAVVADLGCGDAKISASVKNKVHSFDLVAANDRVTSCDMAHVSNCCIFIKAGRN